MSTDAVYLIVAAAVLIAWLVIRVRGWSRMPEDERDPLASHLGGALRTEWPLLAILLLPVALTVLPGLSLRATFLLLGVVLLWWIADAVGYLQEAPDPVRDPLVCAVQGARRLARSPWLIAVLVVLWVGPWVTGVLQTRPGRADVEPPRSDVAQSEASEMSAGGFSGVEAPSFVTDRDAAPIERLLEIVRNDLVSHLPRERSPLPVSTMVLLAIVAVAVLYGRLRFGGSPEERGRAAWAFRLTILLALMSAIPYYIWLRGFGPVNLNEWPHSLWWLASELYFIWGAPYAAFVWHVMLQVVRGRRWDVTEAARAAAESWLPFIGLLLVAQLPSLVLVTVPNLLIQTVHEGMTEQLSLALFHMTQITSDLFSPVYFMFGLGLVLAPWLLADRRIGMREALPQSWRTARERATDLLTFTLRYVVLFAAARWLTGFTRTGQWDAEPSVAGLTGRLLHSAAWLMAVLVIGVLYQHLKDARTEVIEPQPDPTEAT